MQSLRRCATVAFALLLAGCAVLLPTMHPQQVRALERRMSELRRLPVESETKVVFLERTELSGVLERELREQASEKQVDEYSDALVALGLFPRGLDFVQTVLALQQEQVQGFYVPRARTLYVLPSRAWVTAASERRIIVAHELVHALQHQHNAELFTLFQGLRHNDDVQSAISSAIEGDATVMMLGAISDGALARADSLGGDMPTSILDEANKNESLAAAPVLLRLSLVFPYAYGTPIAAAIYTKHGAAGLDYFLSDPPLATASLLAHAPRSDVSFVGLPLDEIALRLRRHGCEIRHHNVAGGLGLEALFAAQLEAAARRALLAAWRGDRFVQISCGESWELAWLSVWESEAAARSFAQAWEAPAREAAAMAPLSGPARPTVSGKRVLALTPGLAKLAQVILDESEVRAYHTLAEWRADGCFPETPCPGAF